MFEASGDYAGLGQTPLMSGFVYTVKLCRCACSRIRLVIRLTCLVLGEALNKRSQDRCRSPRGLALQMRINEITALGELTETLMHDCPRELMLDDGEKSAWYELGGLAASVPIRYRDGFLVQATNIYITQVGLHLCRGRVRLTFLAYGGIHHCAIPRRSYDCPTT